MKFIRTDEYEANLFMQALDEKHVVKDAIITIKNAYTSHPKAWCDRVGSYLQFPRDLRSSNAVYVADVIEVIPKDRSKFYRAVKGSIRKYGSDQVIA